MRDIVSEPRSILILYGSQSGNSEELAEQAGKACTNHGLNASVKAMDEIQINDFQIQFESIQKVKRFDYETIH